MSFPLQPEPPSEPVAVNWVDSVEGLLGLVDMGVVEVHPWAATVDDIEHADQIVLDLDSTPRGAKVYLYHIKPAVIDEVKAEVKALRKDFLHVCELDEVYKIQ